ncbi:hypothetical protein AAFF_G00011880 [Aldrovandia affinis]|uniref:Uncharacterized protein n=1 Tax=Aldrovandia affinis TaxID=143900 RepID=A0AAD7S6F3_9TELE|nr:hypothetical protein AAFF_G00011880 [Aldrovandia affinis]
MSGEEVSRAANEVTSARPRDSGLAEAPAPGLEATPTPAPAPAPGPVHSNNYAPFQPGCYAFACGDAKNDGEGEALKSPVRQTNRYRSAGTDRYEGVRELRYLLLVEFRDAPSRK